MKGPKRIRGGRFQKPKAPNKETKSEPAKGKMSGKDVGQNSGDVAEKGKTRIFSQEQIEQAKADRRTAVDPNVLDQLFRATERSF